MSPGARQHRSALSRYWKELAAQARQEASEMPEGEAKRSRFRIVVHYENLARQAAQSPPPEED